MRFAYCARRGATTALDLIPTIDYIPDTLLHRERIHEASPAEAGPQQAGWRKCAAPCGGAPGGAGPTSLGLRVPGGGPDGSPGSLASSHGVSQTPGASRRSIPAAAGRKKGKGRARPPSKIKTPGPLSIGFSAFPRQRQRVPRHVPKNRQPFRNQNTSREFDAWARNHASRSMGVAVGTGAGRVKV